MPVKDNAPDGTTRRTRASAGCAAVIPVEPGLQRSGSPGQEGVQLGLEIAPPLSTGEISVDLANR
jgi:hypothetical protein